MKITTKSQKEKKIKNNVSKMKNAFYELISTPDMVEERIYELEDISIAISKTKDRKQTNRISKDYGTTIRGVIHA